MRTLLDHTGTDKTLAPLSEKPSLSPQTPKTRILFIDMARFLGISLVFYGHFVERLMYLENGTAAAQYKFIYSFHMVLFFILAGYVARQRDLSLPFREYLKHRLLSRLLPFAFFTMLFMGLTAFLPGDFFHLRLPSMEGYKEGLLSTLFGIPLFCVPSWFILIIFSVELIHYAAFRMFRSDVQIVIGIVGFYVAGYLFNWHFDIFNPLKGRTIGWNYLFAHEAVTMYAFFLTGVYLRRKRFLHARKPPGQLIGLAALMFLIVLFTYRLNRGLFSFSPLDAVVILFSSHGHFIWFPLTAIAGSLMMLLLARAVPAWRTISWMGRNTLILMCLNGIFYHYINPPMARWVVDHLPQTPGIVLLVCSGMTLASLTACIPLIFILNRWIPQLVGKPKLRGPLIRELI